MSGLVRVSRQVALSLSLRKGGVPAAEDDRRRNGAPSLLRPLSSLLCLLAALARGGAAPEGNPIERLVPADAIAVVQVADMAKLRTAFDQSALAQAVKTSHFLSYLRTASTIGVDFAAALVTGVSSAEVQSCLGPHAGLALLAFTDGADLRQRVPIVLLAEVIAPKKLEGILTAQFQILSLLREDLALSKREHAGATIREMSLPKGDRLAFCFRDNVLILGGRGGVEALLDSLAAGTPRLAAAPPYLAVRQKLPSEGCLSLYVNVRAVLEKAGLAADPARLGPLRILGVAEAQAAGLAVDFDGRQLREQFFVHLPGRPTGVLRILTEGQPITATAAQFVPADYTAVVAMGLNEVGLWDRLRTMLMDVQGPAAADFLDTMGTQIEKQLGFHPKTALFDTLGDELFAAVSLGHMKEFFGSGRQPKPQELPFIVGARLRDAATLKDTSDRLAAHQGLWDQGVQRTTEQRAGTAVFSFRTPLNAELKPSHATVNDVLLFSLRPEPVGAALDALKSSKGFAAAAGQPSPAHLFLQVNDAQLLASLLDCVRQDLPDGVQRLLPEMDLIIGGLHGYQASLRREAGGVSLVARSDLGTLGTLVAAILMLDQGNALIARRVNTDFDQIGKALEAYRAKNNAYPETLEQLVPDYLPALLSDRFAPARPYSYSRGKPGNDGRLPDAWVITSVGPDDRVDIPVEQFDPPAWAAKLKSQQPEDIEQLKRVIYRFHPELYADERKNDDEGDLFRMGGKGLDAGPAVAPPVPAPAPPVKAKPPDVAPRKETF